MNKEKLWWPVSFLFISLISIDFGKVPNANFVVAARTSKKIRMQVTELGLSDLTLMAFECKESLLKVSDVP